MIDDKKRFVELEWVCPNCDGRNKGSKKTCESCGAPQPENVKFQRAADEQIVSDEKKVAAAKAGADIHCGFCGTRNPGSAVTCSQCGGDLKEGKAREAGKVLEAAPKPLPAVLCENCGTENSGGSRSCKKCGAPLLSKPASKSPVEKPVEAPLKKTNWLLIGGIIAFALLCLFGILSLFVFPSKSVTATVSGVEWQTSIPVQEMQPVNYTHRSGSAPSDAYNISCQTESQEICEDKTVDQGNGFAEVVRECYTDSTEYCDYTLDEWTTIQTYTLNGNDTFPVYDQPSLTSDQRLGTNAEELTVYFATPDGQETYHPASISDFQQYEVGSKWTLKMNAAGGILSVEK